VEEIEVENIPELSKDAQKVLERFKGAKAPFKRTDVEKFLDCSDSKANNVLSELGGRLERLGVGPSTKYRVLQK
jgi:Fic family protein